MTMEKSIGVRILGREYRLRVRDEDEAVTREIAAYVDAKMSAFHRAHPGQPELTSAIIVALSLAEELFEARAARDALNEHVAATAGDLAAMLDGVLASPTPSPPPF